MASMAKRAGGGDRRSCGAVATAACACVLAAVLTTACSTHETTSSASLARLDHCFAESRTMFEAGFRYFEQNQLDSAAMTFESIRNRCPESPFGWHGALILANVEGDSATRRASAKEVLSHLERIHTQRPALWDGYLEFLNGAALAVGLEQTNDARRHYQSACLMGEGRGCSNMGYLLETVEKQPAEARSWYDKGCAAGYGRACTNMGVIEETTLKDKTAALASYRKGCAMKHPGGCRNAGQILEVQGSIGPALTAYGEACRLGDAAACQRQTNLRAKDGEPPAN